MSRPTSDTRVTELTPAGRAAVAVVLVEGPDATELVGACVHRVDGRSLIDYPIGRILVGHWDLPVGEELVVCRRSEGVVEIHCHGGTAAVEAVIQRLLEGGCRRTSWQEQIHETAGDPIGAAAQIALAAAPTARTAAVLLDQLQGALSRAVREVVAAVEARNWAAAVTALEAVLSYRGVGLHLTRPWRVVLAGRPNVGKSSLLNALVGFERAIVCDMPGTTRDVVTAMTAIDGWPILLADTAGLRETRDEIESAGVERATVAAGDADLVVLVCDTIEADEADLPPNVRVLRVLNKIDLHPKLKATSSDRFDVRTSVVTGAGVAELVTTIGKTLVPTPPAAREAVAFTGEQVAMLDSSLVAARRQDAQAALDCLRPLLNR